MMGMTIYRKCWIIMPSVGRTGWFDYAHKNYDGAPEHSESGPTDHRCGTEKTVEDCKRAIEERFYEEEAS